MKEIKVLSDKCIGCGACVMIDEEHFGFDNEQGISQVISQENVESEKVAEAINACPVAAIEMVESNVVPFESEEQELAA